MTGVKELLDQGVEDLAFAAPGAGLYAEAHRRRRRTRGAALAGGAAAVALVAGGGWAASSGALPFLGGRVDTVRVASAADAPACARDQLRTMNTNVVRYQQAAVILDIPATPKVELAEGLTRGYGWQGVKRVQVLRAVPQMTPPETFALWEGTTREVTPSKPGRYLATVFVDAAPKVPGGSYAEPIWGLNVIFFPVDGESILVTCPGGEQTRIPLADATDSWLAPGAPVDPLPSVPSGASTASPTGSPPSGP